MNLRKMFADALCNPRNRYKTAVADVFEAAEANPTGEMRRKKNREYAAASYDLDSYKDQKIFASIKNKKGFISLKSNREDCYHDQYCLKRKGGLSGIMNSYRDSNNLKCLHFVYELEDTGKIYKDQKKFIAAVRKYNKELMNK